jgi:predicted DNA-binding transcriptional regulator YafY
MNRMDRLTAMVLLLQDKPRTSNEMAGHFEVSRRTILRDVQALCEIGVPVISQEGVGGGYSLPDEYRIRPLPLNTKEAILLLLALGVVEQLSASPFATERASLLAKLRALVPDKALPEADATLERVSLAMPHKQEAPYLDELLQATREKGWVNVLYHSSRGKSELLLQPVRLWCAGGLWYCRAFSHSNEEDRTYRVDRFEEVEAADPPEQVVQRSVLPYSHPSHPEVVIRLTAAGVVEAEREQHLGHAVQRADDGSGIWRFRCPPSEFDWLSRYVLRMGLDALIEEPPDLRERVRKLSEDILSHHAKR